MRKQKGYKGLTYVESWKAGITRERVKGTFRYRGPDGCLVRDPAHLARIRALAIPPAWTGVWICPSPGGHLQATGRDARGRKQHRYHATWIAGRSAAKFTHIIEFAEALPALRRQALHDLGARGMPRRKVLGLIAFLLERTLIRIGNDEYARTNGSFGLTSLHDRHVQVRGAQARFSFRGKSGKDHDVTLSDRRLARLIKQCRDLPGHHLFRYVEANRSHDIGSADVNAYLRDAMGSAFTAKDFRTWGATVLACRALAAAPAAASRTAGERQVVRALDEVAGHLGNTRAICRKSYVHPAVVDSYLEGELHRRVRLTSHSRPEQVEAAVIALLKSRAPRRAAARAA